MVEVLTRRSKMATKMGSRMLPVAALALAMGVAQCAPNSMAENTQNDSQTQAQLTTALSNKRFKDVSASVQDGVVSLAGTVDVYGVKADAEKKAHKLRNVTAVRDDIQVGGPTVSDQVLQDKLLRRIQTDRIG